MLPFAGTAITMIPNDIQAAALSLGCDAAAIRAVLTVEAGGSGFLSDSSGRPRILFEAHHFSMLTRGIFDASHPGISSGVQNWHLYKGGAAEYDRLAEAVALNRAAAIASTSWGLFQILGSNCVACGIATPEAFAAAMGEGEGRQLAAFVAFCKSDGGALRVALCNRDWPGFARRYNGPAYAVNHYDTKLAVAFIGTPPGNTAASGAVLQIGAKGTPVFTLQAAMTSRGFFSGAVDGDFGPATQFAVMRVQEAGGLTIDGVVGAATRSALGISA